MPVYNGADYMREAIDSVLAQTYKNIEVILVNDGSKDNTEEIAKSYGDKIRYFAKENGGVASALNLALEKATGEYISWLSHDDVYYPDKLEKQIRKLSGLEEKDRSSTILMSNYTLIDEKSKVLNIMQFHKLFDQEKLNYPLFPILNGLVHGCTLLIPKHCFDNVGYFDEKLRATQDYDLWFKMFPCYKTIFMPDILIKSRWHSEQGSKKIETANQEADELWIGMVEGLTDEQKIKIGGGIASFYEKTRKIMKGANYAGAAQYLTKKIDALKNRDISEIKVSIIIPFHNRIGWTLQAAQSALDQTHANLEVILVDDSSTDDIQPLKDLAEKNNRLKLIENKRSRGAGGARNTGLDMTSGEYIAFLDSDDLFLPEKISKQLEFMVRNNHLFSHTSYLLFSDNGRINKEIKSGKTDCSFPSIIANCPAATPTIMMHTDLFKDKQNRFPEKYSVGEDVCLWNTISKISPCVGLWEILTRVRMHKKNTAYDKEKHIHGISNILNFAIENLLNHDTAKYIKELNQALAAELDKHYKKEKLVKRIINNRYALRIYKSALFENKIGKMFKKSVLAQLHRLGFLEETRRK